MPRGSARRAIHLGTLLFVVSASAACTEYLRPGPGPTIAFTQVPPADQGGTELVDTIRGQVTGAAPGQRLVLFAKAGTTWWVQPGPNEPYTPIAADGTFTQSTHLGSEYAALLVRDTYVAPYTTDALPQPGGSVVAVATIDAPASRAAPRTFVKFAGYEWIVRASPSDRGGGLNRYDTANAWVDEAGALHLRLSKDGDGWRGAQVIQTRSFGYGTYEFVVRDVGDLDPAAVFAFYTLDLPSLAGAEKNPREWDVEFSRWGEPADPNARYVVQPWAEPTNRRLFAAPAGPLTVSVRWARDRVVFRTTRGAAPGGAVVAEHTFTSSVPVPGSERLRIHFFDFQRGRERLQRGGEVVVERFTHTP